MTDWKLPPPPANADPAGMWECGCDCSSCVMAGPHEAHADHATDDAAWIQPGSPDWPFGPSRVARPRLPLSYGPKATPPSVAAVGCSFIAIALVAVFVLGILIGRFVLA